MDCLVYKKAEPTQTSPSSGAAIMNVSKPNLSKHGPIVRLATAHPNAPVKG